MLPLTDPQIRLALLNDVAVKLSKGEVAALQRAGVDSELLAHLREISAIDLKRLAEMRELIIAVAFKSAGLAASLRRATLVDDAKALETYFIRHGASSQMMNELFKLGRKVTQKRRREAGAWRAPGRFVLPDCDTRKRIFCAWLAITDPNPRRRYFVLHQRFSELSIAALAAVVRKFEAHE